MNLKGLGTRASLLNAYLSPRRDFPFTLGETLRGMLKPTAGFIGKRHIEKVEEHDAEFLAARLRGLRYPLYWPKALPIFDLYKAATDCLDQDNWHYYEAPETQVQRGDVVLDCGAAEGMFSLSVAERAGRVVAFEPWPGFKESLRRTFAPCPQAEHVAAALGSAEGTACLAGESLYGFIHPSEGVPVRITTVDAWTQQTGSRVDYIKGDLEAFELEVLKGAAETIRRWKPKIAITVYHPGNDWKEMLKLLRALAPQYRYRVKGLSYNQGAPRPVMLHAWVPPEGPAS
jgi:FkbM family methyltransferase